MSLSFWYSFPVSWQPHRLVMQDHKDPQAFTIVERYAHESSQKWAKAVRWIRHLTTDTVKISLGEPILENLRPIYYSAFDEANWAYAQQRAWHEQASACGPRSRVVEGCREASKSELNKERIRLEDKNQPYKLVVLSTCVVAHGGKRYPCRWVLRRVTEACQRNVFKVLPDTRLHMPVLLHPIPSSR